MTVTMKLSVLLLGAFIMATPAGADEAQVLGTPKDKLSYGLGVDIARNFKKQEIEVDLDLLLKGLKDGLAGGKILLSDREFRTLMTDLQNDMRKKAVLNRRKLSGDNKMKGYDYLEANRKKPGVVVLPSGVQYRVLSAGDGKKPADGDQVECYYRATLIDGTEFDSTEEGKPATLKVSQQVPGWREALKLMPAGSKWQIFVPGQLAYGERGWGNDIGPNETLVFEVQLLAVK